ncbi:Hypothetical protein CINCED_3A008413 [Cinara cedri]|uniref:Homeobox domain-containing protein n=1 Tax=Cinara cedri TaxID=506608 RepID=A0A5E4MQ77_9HEMI|nr:Hypothetical protein CINCED_3A008413 [Cinara cedri]
MSAYHWDQLRPDAHHHRPQPNNNQQHEQLAVSEPLPAEGKGGNKRSRQTYSKYQTAVLETVFQTSKYIVRSKRQQMSVELNLTERQIKIWFQNRRMKEKKCSHKDAVVARADGLAGLATTAAGYANDYATAGGGAYLGNCQPSHGGGRDDVFADYDDRLPVSKHLRDDVGHAAAAASYAGCGSGGYDLPEIDPYGVMVQAKEQWSPVDFRQDFYNGVVPDYCGGGPTQQLQVAHGY